VVYTDDLARKVMVESIEVKEKIIKEFGEIAYMPDGSVNSRQISEIVFSPDAEGRKKLRTLEQIVHPAVIDEMIKSVDELEVAGEDLIFVESALIFEVGLEEGFDFVITVDSDIDNIIDRGAKRGYTPAQVEQRLKDQISLQEKRSRADFVIENNGSLEELKSSTLAIWEIIETMIS